MLQTRIHTALFLLLYWRKTYAWKIAHWGGVTWMFQRFIEIHCYFVFCRWRHMFWVLVRITFLRLIIEYLLLSENKVIFWWINPQNYLWIISPFSFVHVLCRIHFTRNGVTGLLDHLGLRSAFPSTQITVKPQLDIPVFQTMEAR